MALGAAATRRRISEREPRQGAVMAILIVVRRDVLEGAEPGAGVTAVLGAGIVVHTRDGLRDADRCHAAQRRTAVIRLAVLVDQALDLGTTDVQCGRQEIEVGLGAATTGHEQAEAERSGVPTKRDARAAQRHPPNPSISIGRHNRPGAQTLCAPGAKLHNRTHWVPRPVLTQM